MNIDTVLTESVGNSSITEVMFGLHIWEGVVF